MSQESASTSNIFVRRPYTGGCHCGTIKYIAYLSLPTSDINIHGLEFREKSGLSIYKCNCTVCNKMGIFHMRLRHAPDDFLLLSPTDVDAEDSGITNYTANKHKNRWYFCKTCGVRCFSCTGDTENAEVDVPVKSLKELGLLAGTGVEGETIKKQVWRMKKEGFAEGKGGKYYFSLNAVTLTPGQEGLDLATLHEKEWIGYVDSLDNTGDLRVGKPHRGGIY